MIYKHSKQKENKKEEKNIIMTTTYMKTIIKKIKMPINDVDFQKLYYFLQLKKS